MTAETDFRADLQRFGFPMVEWGKISVIGVDL